MFNKCKFKFKVKKKEKKDWKKKKKDMFRKLCLRFTRVRLTRRCGVWRRCVVQRRWPRRART